LCGGAVYTSPIKASESMGGCRCGRSVFKKSGSRNNF